MKNGPYILVFAPMGYPGKKYRGKYCYEHHLVYWQHHGITIEKGQVIHHINHNKTDNRVENLQLKQEVEHKREHSLERGKDARKLIECTTCKNQFLITFGQYKYKSKKNKVGLFCSRECLYVWQTGRRWKKFRGG